MNLTDFGVIADNLQFIVPAEAETMLLPEQNADPFKDPDGFKADLTRQNWFWAKLLGEHPSAVQYSSGALTSVLSQFGGAYRLSVFDNRGPLSHREVHSPAELLRETQNWRGEIEVLR